MKFFLKNSLLFLSAISFVPTACGSHGKNIQNGLTAITVNKVVRSVFVSPKYLKN
jgi:hypothetical protein